MAEFLVFSDFHAHNFNAFSKQVPFKHGTINSRLKDCLDVIAQMRAYAKKNKIKCVLFGGDLFHTRSAVKTDVYNVIYSAIDEWVKQDNMYLLMIPGNHDMADRRGLVHSLEGFKRLENVYVKDAKVDVYVLDGVAIVTVPYTVEREEAVERLAQAGGIAAEVGKNAPVILLAHLGMQGAKVGSDYVLVSDNDISVSDVPYDKFSICLFGHYHQHQQLFDNGWFIGATHHHNWGDAGTTRGFLHLTVDPNGKTTFKQVETTVPRFVHLDGDETAVMPRKTDFVRVHTQLEITDEVKAGLVATIGPNIEIVSKRVKKEADTFELKEEDIHPTGLVEAWVKEKHGGLDQDKLKQVGTNLLAKAESRSL